MSESSRLNRASPCLAASVFGGIRLLLIGGCLLGSFGAGAAPEGGGAGGSQPEPAPVAPGTPTPPAGQGLAATPDATAKPGDKIKIESIASGGRGTLPATLQGGTFTLKLREALKPEQAIEAVKARPKDADGNTPTTELTVVEAKSPTAQGATQGIDQVVVRVPFGLEGQYLIDTLVIDGADRAAQPPYPIRVIAWWWVILVSLLPLLATFALVWLIIRSRIKASANPRQAVLAVLLVDPKTDTYSLSRAQFITWTLVIAWAYVFVFVANGIVRNAWAFPSLEGFASTFLISLGTLLGAQFTSSVRGSKGSGQLGPQSADLFMHGGVMALERVQQSLWTLIGAGLFVRIVLAGYGDAGELPAVPDEMLTLMGLSSLGYVGGKLVRKAGPVISQVVAEDQGLVVRGDGLSREVLVWVDQKPLEGSPEVIGVPTADEQVKELVLPYAMLKPRGIPRAPDWYTQGRRLVMVNPDSQRAEWSSKPEIVNVKPGDKANELAVETRYLGANATWVLRSAGGRSTGKASKDEKGRLIVTGEDSQWIVNGGMKKRPLGVQATDRFGNVMYYELDE